MSLAHDGATGSCEQMEGMPKMRKRQVLVVDDTVMWYDLCHERLSKDYETSHASTKRECVGKLSSERVDCVILDLRFGDDLTLGFRLLREIRKLKRDMPVVVYTATPDDTDEWKALRLGATSVVSKRDKVKNRLLHEVQLAMEPSPKGLRTLIGESDHMYRVRQQINRFACLPSTVLILGETGTGKELVANALHHHSMRRHKIIVVRNCGAIPPGLEDSELFGHVKGAFTGAHEDKEGWFEIADGGSLFMDEVGELSEAAQVKLLRTLGQGMVIRVGGKKEIDVDVRVIAATNREVWKSGREGAFRSDLLSRLEGHVLKIPPLRERREDIPLLVRHFCDLLGEDRPVEDESMEQLLRLNWPGNVRDLKNVIGRMSDNPYRRELVFKQSYLLEPDEEKSHGAEGVEGPREWEARMKEWILEWGTSTRMPTSDELSWAYCSALNDLGNNNSEVAEIIGKGRDTVRKYLRQWKELTGDS